ncbi:MAG: hypothetical protein QS99_C0018G0005 [archaeon GW2011_AR4]|nr:MAG: hypothetical protein QS99_C0018G0005 [archaeon GW2011_AR4]
MEKKGDALNMTLIWVIVMLVAGVTVILFINIIKKFNGP